MNTLRFPVQLHQPTRWYHSRVVFALMLMAILAFVMTMPVSSQGANPLCEGPSTTTIILDTNADGLFVRADADGTPVSRAFDSTEVWIVGDLTGRVTVQLSPSAAIALKDNDVLTFLNRTDNDLCINMDLSAAVGELSDTVVITDSLLQIGESTTPPILIDLSSFDTLTILDDTFENASLTAANVINAISSEEPEQTEQPAQPDPPTACSTITPELDGQALRLVLNAIASDNHNSITYGDVKDALRVVDRDPDNANNVILIYSNRSQDRLSFESDPTPIDRNDRWNREHMWARSHGPGDHPSSNADLYHLYAEDKSVNEDRGNQDFGEVEEIEAHLVTDGPGNTPVDDTYDDDTFWEPRDEIKGDVARSLFYMDIRYEGADGEPDLALVEGTTTTDSEALGDLTALLAWAEADPVSEGEIARAARVVEIQGNINPFITCADQIDLAKLWPAN